MCIRDRLRTSCAAYEILHFDPRTGKQNVSDNQRDTAWHTRTSTLGFDAMGIWPYGADGTDVNAVDRSNARAHLVTADDFGGVNAFNYPVLVDEAPRAREAGHSSHVMNVRFSPDDRWVVSVGGKDRAVFQWRFHRTPRAEERADARAEAALYRAQLRGKAPAAVGEQSNATKNSTGNVLRRLAKNPFGKNGDRQAALEKVEDATRRELEADGVEILTNVSFVAVSVDEAEALPVGVAIRETNDFYASEKRVLRCDALLVAAGRKPRVAGLVWTPRASPRCRTLGLPSCDQTCRRLRGGTVSS